MSPAPLSTIASALALGLAGGPAQRLDAKAAWSLHSAEARTNLVELYSSEGCSSCPPADAWLASLRSRADLWTRFVPIEFHVDYWNRLGWQDRFARATFTGRQREYGNEWGSSSVYTPGFVLNGKEWHASKGPLGEGSGALGGVLQVQAEGAEVFHVSYRPTAAKKRWTVYAALLGNGLTSKVTSGENQGETLHHEFVVLNLQTTSMSEAGAEWQAQLTLAPPKNVQAKSYSLAVWVAEAGQQAPAQAVGGNLP